MDFLKIILKYKNFVIIGCLALAVFSFLSRELAVGLIFIAFLAAISMFFIDKIKDEKQKKILGTLFLIVFLLHALAVFFVYYTNFQPFSGGRGDFIYYNLDAQKISERIHQGNFSINGLSTSHLYPVIVGYLYAFTTPKILIGELFNAWMVSLIAIFIYLIVREVGRSEKEGFIIGLIVAVYPSLAFYSSLLLKEAITILFVTIALLMSLKIIKEFSWKKFVILYLALIGVFHFRFYIGYALILAFIISWFFLSNMQIKKRAVYGIIIFLLMGFLPQISIVGVWSSGYFGIRNFTSFLNPNTITYYRETVYAPTAPEAPQPGAEPSAKKDEVIKPALIEIEKVGTGDGRESSTTIKTGLENPITFLANTTLSFIFSLLGPYPWQLKKLSQLLVLPEIIPWYFFLFFIIKGVFKNIKKEYKAMLPLLFFSILVIGSLCLFMTNFGITTRIRMPAILALLCLLPFGLKSLNNIKIPFLENYIF
jgi:hypothetical protein